jgi:ferric-dicitrate binding protein FerR (iron transport regulator)
MGIDCRQAAELGTRVLSGNGSTTDAVELEKHFLACPPCRDSHARVVKVWGLMGALPQIALSPAAAREVSRAVGAGRFRRLYWIAGAAAAALLGVASFILMRPDGQVPAEVSHAPPPIARPVPPAEPNREPAPQEIERDRVEQLLEQEKQPATTPEPPNPGKSEPPAPVPAIQTPVIPVPSKPEEKQVAREEVKPSPKVMPPENEKPVAIPGETALPAGTLDRTEGTVFVVIGGRRSPAKAGQPIPSGAGLETAGAGSQAIFEYADGSRVALGADTILLQVCERRTPSGKPAEGKLIQVLQGILAAQIVRQPVGESMLFLTPHAEAKVLGTRLSLSVAAAVTRLDVRQGKVKLTRKEDGQSAEVTEGHFAMAGKGIAPASKPAPGPRMILHETFERGRWSAALAQGGDATSGLRFSTETGSLALQMAQKSPPDISPGVVAPGTPGAPGVKIPADVAKKAVESVARGAALGAKGELPRALWLETRQTFALSNDTPLRLRIRLWQSNGDTDRSSWFTVNRSMTGQALSLERRGDVLELWSEAAQAAVWKKEFLCVQEWEVLELWLTKDLVVVRRNDLTVHAGSNPVKAKIVQFSFGANAKAELAQDGEIRIDDLQLSWMTKADLEDVIR